MVKDKPQPPEKKTNGYDPTYNVIALVEAESRRQDDLRSAADKLHDEQNKRLQESVSHAEFVSDLRSQHAEQVASIRDSHIVSMRKQESERIDAIRQVDVNATMVTANQAQQAIQALAATTKTDAENLRNSLVTTAATIAKQTADTFLQVTDRIAALEKSTYEGVGKQRVVDPMMGELLDEVKALRDARQNVVGEKKGMSVAVQIAIGAVGLICTVGFIITSMIAIYAFAVSLRNKTDIKERTPQPVYLSMPNQSQGQSQGQPVPLQQLQPAATPSTSPMPATVLVVPSPSPGK